MPRSIQYRSEQITVSRDWRVRRSLWPEPCSRVPAAACDRINRCGQLGFDQSALSTVGIECDDIMKCDVIRVAAVASSCVCEIADAAVAECGCNTNWLFATFATQTNKQITSGRGTTVIHEVDYEVGLLIA